MLTPRFEVDQDENFLILNIACPFSRGKDVEFFMEGKEFRFSLNPYYLRLRFSHEIVEDGTEHSEWHIDDGTIKVWIPKRVKGQRFSDLDMITKLLATKRELNQRPTAAPLIQEIDSEELPSHYENAQDEDDWELEQKPAEPLEDLLGRRNCYGFDRSYSGVLEAMPQEFQFEIFGASLNELDQRNISKFRAQQEIEQFDIEHYLFDFVDEDGNISDLLQKKFWFSPKSLDKMLEGSLSIDGGASSKIAFSSREQQELVGLKIKEKYFINNPELVFAGLLELLLAFAYVSKVYDGEYDNPEVAWNIVTLCPMMRYLEPTTQVESVIGNFMIRSLSYPLYRNWELSYSCLLDAQRVIGLGRAAILRALIWLKLALQLDESRCAFCKIFINDYCGWIQTDSFDALWLEKYSKQLNAELAKVDKKTFAFVPLIEIEALLNEGIEFE